MSYFGAFETWQYWQLWAGRPSCFAFDSMGALAVAGAADPKNVNAVMITRIRRLMETSCLSRGTVPWPGHGRHRTKDSLPHYCPESAMRRADSFDAGQVVGGGLRPDEGLGCLLTIAMYCSIERRDWADTSRVLAPVGSSRRGRRAYASRPEVRWIRMTSFDGIG